MEMFCINGIVIIGRKFLNPEQKVILVQGSLSVL